MSDLLAITGGNVIDVRTGIQQPSATVLVDGDHIVAVAAHNMCPRPRT